MSKSDDMRKLINLTEGRTEPVKEDRGDYNAIQSYRQWAAPQTETTTITAGSILRREIRRMLQRQHIEFTEDKGILDSQFVVTASPKVIRALRASINAINDGEVDEGVWSGIPSPHPDSINVYQDKDTGQWFWTRSLDGHVIARGTAPTEAEADEQAYGKAEEDMLEPHAQVLDEVEEHAIHLLRPRGGSECGAPCDSDTCSPEINNVTCPECIHGHDEYMRKFDMQHDGDIEEGYDSFFDIPEDDLDAQIAWMVRQGHTEGAGPAWMLTIDGPPAESPIAAPEMVKKNRFAHIANEIEMGKRQGVVFGNVHWMLTVDDDSPLKTMDIPLDEEIESDTVTGPAYWASYLINGDDSGMSSEEKAACDAWQKRLEPYYVVGTTDDEPRFTNHYALHSGTDIQGGDVIDYIVHKDTDREHDATTENPIM